MKIKQKMNYLSGRIAVFVVQNRVCPKRAGDVVPAVARRPERKKILVQVLIMARQIRSEAIRVRLTKSELAALTALSEEVGLSVSETLRRLSREASGLGPSFSGTAAHGIAANVAQLRKAGVNLNQITRALNSGRTPGYADLKGGVERLGRIVAEQMDLLEAMCARGRRRAVARVRQDV